MEVVGSSDFQAQIQFALSRWQSVDAEADDLCLSITRIVEHSDGFKVYTLDNGDIFVAHNIAFWPHVGLSLQRDLLATYLAHEGSHVYLREMDNVHWNDAEGEELANRYQELIGDRLGIPRVYIADPARTLGPQYRQFVNDNEEWMKVGGLAVAALAALAVANRA